jgi:hypothetical protein
VVVASVGEHAVRPFAGPPDLAAHRRDTLDERDKLGDVVAVAARNTPSERDPGRVYEKVMLGAVSGSINRARARRGAPYMKGAGGASRGFGGARCRWRRGWR